MFEIRYVSGDDAPFWFTLDDHMCESEFQGKVRERRGYLLTDAGRPVGIMRYNLFLDTIPYLTLICLAESCRRKGFGRQAMLFWENEMRERGYPMVMTSTNVDEEAQHFYRKLGYVDRGGLFLDNTPIPQPQELLMIKVL